MKANLLIVDDEYRTRQSLSMQLERQGFDVAMAASGAEALKQLALKSFDYALVDVKMKEMTGLELLRRIKASYPNVVVIIMTAFSNVSNAIEAIKSGAFHYLPKPIQLDELLETLSNAEPARRSDPFQGIRAESSLMRNAIAIARRAAESDKPVLITGEVGTGKEALASAIHAGSPRASAPFVVARCTTVGDVEEELFGRSVTQPGRLTESHGGSLMVESVTEATDSTQRRLLAFLQDGEIRWEGARPTRSDVRLIATSTLDLGEAVESGRLSAEMKLRLASFHIHVPPLRERPNDIPLLANALVEKYSPRGAARIKLTRSALDMLQRLPLPGNVLELEAIIEQAVSLAGDKEITEEVLLSAGVDAPPAASVTEHHPLKVGLEREECKLIEESLTRNGHNLRLVAIDLEISRTSLWRKMKRCGLAD